MGINYVKKPTKYSYSRLNTFEQCGFKYYLQYDQGHYIHTDSLAADFGTLCHKILEDIGLDLKFGRKPDYEKYIKDFYDLNIPKKDEYDTEGGIFGIKILQKKYAREFFEGNKDGVSFDTKANAFINTGIYRLENYISAHPGLSVWGCEQYFDVNFINHRFSGKIDRILYDEINDKYIIEDIKTKDHPFKESELITPLQFVVYVKALCDILGIKEEQIECYYDLPICDLRQKGGTKGFVKRGVDKLASMFKAIENKDFVPHPSPLCHFCAFCRTNLSAPDEGKYLCPYYSLWTRENKTHEVENEWEGIERHEKIMEKYNKDIQNDIIIGDLDF